MEIDNKMCDVYDMILRIKQHNKRNEKAKYKIVEKNSGKEPDIYYIKNLIAEVCNGFLSFDDEEGYLRTNYKGLTLLLIDSISSIRITDQIEIIHSKTNNITIHMI